MEEKMKLFKKWIIENYGTISKIMMIIMIIEIIFLISQIL